MSTTKKSSKVLSSGLESFTNSCELKSKIKLSLRRKSVGKMRNQSRAMMSSLNKLIRLNSFCRAILIR
jgi:hypothetical protein